MAKHVKCVHLYGKPTHAKRCELLKMQKLYSNHINFFIEKLLSDRKYYLAILTNNKKSPEVRSLEKENRTKLGSALGQNAIDHAMKELHNHFIRIRNDLYGLTMGDDANNFVSSIALLNACLQSFSVRETKGMLQRLVRDIESKEKPSSADKEKMLFYKNLLSVIEKSTTKEIETVMREVSSLFLIELQVRKTPFVKDAPMQLDSRLCTIEKAENIKADYVISVKTLEHGRRIEIPLKASRNGLRRLSQYGMSSPTIRVTSGGIKISVPFEKKMKATRKSTRFVGIDVGIADLIHTSDGIALGSYSDMASRYEQNVMPKLARRSSLRNLMKKHQSELRNEDTHPQRKEFLRNKICNINRMLQGSKEQDRILRSYYHLQDMRISLAVKDYVRSVKSESVTTVIEDIDIINFDRGKSANRRDSMWARGQLLKKLEERLAWAGQSTTRVDPVYTSLLCPKCSNVDKESRNSKLFKCTHCGHADDADHNASINIRDRAFDSEAKAITEEFKHSKQKRHTALKELYAKRHEEYVATVA